MVLPSFPLIRISVVCLLLLRHFGWRPVIVEDREFSTRVRSVGIWLAIRTTHAFSFSRLTSLTSLYFPSDRHSDGVAAWVVLIDGGPSVESRLHPIAAAGGTRRFGQFHIDAIVTVANWTWPQCKSSNWDRSEWMVAPGSSTTKDH